MRAWKASLLVIVGLAGALGCSDKDDRGTAGSISSGAGSGSIRWEQPALPTQMAFATVARDGRFALAGGGLWMGRIAARAGEFEGKIISYRPLGGLWLDAYEDAQIRGVFDGGFTAWIEAASSLAEVWVEYDLLDPADPSFAAIAGTHQVNLASSSGAVYTLVMTFDALGTVTGSDTAGCAYFGQLHIVDPAQSIYGMDVEVSTCGVVSGAYQGLVTQTQSWIVVTVANPDHALEVSFPRLPAP